MQASQTLVWANIRISEKWTPGVSSVERRSNLAFAYMVQSPIQEKWRGWWKQSSKKAVLVGMWVYYNVLGWIFYVMIDS